METSAEFVLTGGRSSRRGRDDALLVFERLVGWNTVLKIGRTGRNLFDARDPMNATRQRRSTFFGPQLLSILEHKRFKMHGLLKVLKARLSIVINAATLQNVNAPGGWSAQ